MILDGFISERDRWARWSIEALAEVPWLHPPTIPKNCKHAWQSYVTVVDDSAPMHRNTIMEKLQEAGVSTRPGTHAVTELAYYRRKFGIEPGQFPVASQLERQTMALPLHNRMGEEDYHYVAKTLMELAR